MAQTTDLFRDKLNAGFRREIGSMYVRLVGRRSQFEVGTDPTCS